MSELYMIKAFYLYEVLICCTKETNTMKEVIVSIPRKQYSTVVHQGQVPNRLFDGVSAHAQAA